MIRDPVMRELADQKAVREKLGSIPESPMLKALMAAGLATAGGRGRLDPDSEPDEKEEPKEE